MALDAGDANAGSGMGKAIFDAMNAAMKDGIPPDQLSNVQKGWKKLSAAIAQGVVDHLKSNAQINVSGVQASGTLVGQTVNTTQTGSVPATIA